MPHYLMNAANAAATTAAVIAAVAADAAATAINQKSSRFREAYILGLHKTKNPDIFRIFCFYIYSYFSNISMRLSKLSSSILPQTGAPVSISVAFSENSAHTCLSV